MLKNRKISITIILLAGLLLIGGSYGIESHAQNTDSDTAYQEFLEGKRLLTIDKEAYEIMEEQCQYFTPLECGAFSMKEILDEINGYYYTYFSSEYDRMAYLEYSYLGDDKNPKLAVRFHAEVPVAHFELTFFIVYKKDKLYLRHVTEAWSRNSITINPYGYIRNSSSDGAFSGGSYEAMINDNGKVDYVFEKEFDYSDIEEPEISKQVYGTEDCSLLKVGYRIKQKEYLCLFDGSEEEPESDNFKQFKELYEKKNGKIYTQSEIDELIAKRKKQLGITAEMAEDMEADWTIVETAAFKDQVREIELKENRKKERDNSAIVTRGWKSCDKKNLNKIHLSLCDNDCPLTYGCRLAIEYALTDYCNTEKISDDEWTLQQIASYEEGLYAVTLKSNKERALCLMLRSDALDFELPECTEYLPVVDYYMAENDKPVYNGSWLLWTSVYNESNFYSYEIKTSRLFECWDAKKALKCYLTDQNAVESVNWEFDDNLFCIIGYKVMIVRFFSGEQEIIMVVNSDEKVFGHSFGYSVIMKKGIQKRNRSDWEKAYAQIEWGNSSDVQNFEELIPSGRTWLRRDLNHDQIPELLCLNDADIFGDHMAIEYIFTYHDQKTKMVFSNRENESEYYFLGQNGNLLCDYGSYAAGNYHSIIRYEFDAEWTLQKKERLEASCDADGRGLSCLIEEPLTEGALSQNGKCKEWEVTPISAKAFLEEYQRMTGENFLEKGNGWENIFEKAGDTVNGSGFSYGDWTPDTSENEFVKAVKKCETFKGNIRSLTYMADCDGDGAIEAFVVMGKEHTEKNNRFAGESLWFVNAEYQAVKLEAIGDNAIIMQYMKKEKNIYFFFEHYGHVVDCRNTPVYTVQNKRAVCIGEELSDTYKHINKYGQIMMEQNTYDTFYSKIYDNSSNPATLWTGHTWKYYPIKLTADGWLETEARELSVEEVEAISPLYYPIKKELWGDEDSPVIGIQCLLRDNGDLNINIASGTSYGTDELYFHNITIRLSETGMWAVSEYGDGSYSLNYSNGKHWVFLENLDKELDKLKKESEEQ